VACQGRAELDVRRWEKGLQMIRIICLALALTLTVGRAGAQDLTGALKRIKETGVITLGYREASVPFSYLDDKQQPVGYALEICQRIVEAVRSELKLTKLDVKLTPVTAATRIAAIVNGTIDLECGSTTNNAERQNQVAYTNTHFLTATRMVSKNVAEIGKIDDLKGKTVVSTAGSTNIKQLNEVNTTRGLGMTIIPAKDYAEAFLMVETERAAAFVMDDILLAGFVASSKDPKAYVISDEAFSAPEPYGIMLPKDDVAFKKLADTATSDLFQSPEGKALYAKWFTQPIPPKGLNLNIPMSAALKKTMDHPTDSPDPKAY
jgi:glutamate/aspartate transport system substrate-binding protein